VQTDTAFPAGNTAADITKPYASGASQKSAAASRLGAVARDTMDVVQNALDEGKAVAKDQFDATARRVEQATRDKPLKALAIVASVGFVAGLLLARR